MKRECVCCSRPLEAGDFQKEESREMEAERRARGLQGMKFVYYTCSGCGTTDIFVELHRLPDETDEAFQKRREELEATARQLHADRAAVVVAVR